MILDFSVKNYGPFRDMVTLTLQASSLTGKGENVLEVEQVKGGMLSSSVIFGSNGSGKSYLFDAIRSLIRMTSDAYPEGTRYPWYTPFRLSSVSLGSPIEMRIRMIVGGVLYDYSVSYLEDRIVGESLHHYPRGRRAVVFSRDGFGSFIKAKKGISKMTSCSSTYLAVGSKYNDPVCNAFWKALREIILIDGNNLTNLAGISCDYCSGNPSIKELMIKGLSVADFGIKDYTFTESEVDLQTIQDKVPPDLFKRMIDSPGKRMLREIFLIHDFPDNDVSDEELMFPLDIESVGTRFMFGFMGPMADALLNGRTLIVDEFGSALHPEINRWILEQFSGDNNPNNAQLIVNTHDIGLMMDDGPLRRDQIWFVDKDRGSGRAELYALSDFNGIRKDTDILKAYLAGRYDAIPMVSGRGVMR